MSPAAGLLTSLRLHEAFGFRAVGVRERLACHHGRWRDVLLIERRSRAAGLARWLPEVS
jgi:L-amino acid N-acyltransferase YncA